MVKYKQICYQIKQYNLGDFSNAIYPNASIPKTTLANTLPSRNPSLASVASGNDILLIKGDVGTHHARIVKRGEAFTIQLLDMKRPFFVNGRNFGSCPLKYDDKITFPSITTLFLREGAIQTTIPKGKRILGILQGWWLLICIDGTNCSALFGQLLEAIVGLTQAEKGFLIVLQKGDYTIAATHNITSSDSSRKRTV